MATPKLTNVSWLGPKTKWIAPVISWASALSALRSSVSKRPWPINRTRNNVKLKHSEEASQAARQIETKKTFDDYRKKVGS